MGQFIVKPQEVCVNQVPDQIVIPLSRTKIVLLFLGAVAFVLLSVWLWTIADHQTRHNPLYVKAVAIAGASFFGLCAGFAFIKLFDTKPGLIIDSDGIVDNSSGVSAGRVPWQERLPGHRRPESAVHYIRS